MSALTARRRGSRMIATYRCRPPRRSRRATRRRRSRSQGPWQDQIRCSARRCVVWPGRSPTARAHGRALPGRRHRRVSRRGDDRRGDRARNACPAPSSRAELADVVGQQVQGGVVRSQRARRWRPAPPPGGCRRPALSASSLSAHGRYRQIVHRPALSPLNGCVEAIRCVNRPVGVRPLASRPQETCPSTRVADPFAAPAGSDCCSWCRRNRNGPRRRTRSAGLSRDGRLLWPRCCSWRSRARWRCRSPYQRRSARNSV